MKILILGGTAWLGKHIAAAAVAAGHDVTCTARGSAPTAPGGTFVQVDREQDDAFAAVTSQTWDAVVDVALDPAFVARVVQDLSTRQWVYVSSTSVYARMDLPEQDKSAPVVPALADPMTDPMQYGQAKVACE